MADLSSLSADQLTENVRDSLGGPDYAPMDRRWEDVAADAEANLAELQTRANQRDNLAGLEELLAQTEERVRLLKIYALAAEKERDEWRNEAKAQAALRTEELAAFRELEARLAERDEYSRKTGCDCHEAKL